MCVKRGKDKSQRLQQNVYKENIGKILLLFFAQNFRNYVPMQSEKDNFTRGEI